MERSREPERSCWQYAPSARSRPVTTRRSLHGTASRSPRSPRPRFNSDRNDYLDAALGLAEFLLGTMSDDGGRLFRTYRNGHAKINGYLEDYANVANGLLELYVATGELRLLEEANRLARLALDLFEDPKNGGFYFTPVDGEVLVARKKDLDDHPTPSGNSMLAFVLLRLARIYGDEDLERSAVGVFRLGYGLIDRRTGCGRPHALRPRSLLRSTPGDGDRGALERSGNA